MTNDIDSLRELRARAKMQARIERVATSERKPTTFKPRYVWRESLYKALSGERNPAFDTVLKVIKALGLQLHATAV